MTQQTTGVNGPQSIPQAQQVQLPSNQFTQAATAQGAASQYATNQQTIQNRANQTNPYGSLQWSQDPTTGQWTQNVSLNQPGQQTLNAQQGTQAQLAQGAQGLAGGALSSLQQPLDTSQLHGMYNFGTPGQVNAQAQAAVMGQLQPIMDQHSKALDAQLANQGITPGSEAYQNAHDQLARDNNNLTLQGVQAGFQQGNTDFSNNIALGNYQQQQNQQNLGQQQAIRSQGLNDVNALLGSQVQAPQFGQYGQAGVAQTPNYLGAQQSQYNSVLDQQNLSADQQASMTNGLFNLGGAFLNSNWGQGLMNSAGSYLGGLFGLGG